MPIDRNDPGAALLQNIEIPIPCTESWDAMEGDARVRHCGLCRKNVYNLSEMPQAEAAALLAGNTDGQLCVRFYRRADGTVMTSDCSTSPRVKLHRAVRALPIAAAGVAGAAAMALSVAHAAPAQKVRSNSSVEGKTTVAAVKAVPQEPIHHPIMTMGAPPAPPMREPVQQPDPPRQNEKPVADPVAKETKAD